MYPSEGEGYVRAETIREAIALVGHPEERLAQFELGRLLAQLGHSIEIMLYDVLATMQRLPVDDINVLYPPPLVIEAQ